MRRWALVALGLLLIPAVVLADIILKDESTRVGPVTAIDCRGTDLTCTRSGSTAVLTVSVDGGAPEAPADADFLVKTSNGSLSAERVVTNTATVTWDWATAGQAKASVVKLPANGTDCSSGSYARGVDEFGNAESCSTDEGVGTLVRTTADFTTSSSSYVDVDKLGWDTATSTRYSFHCYFVYRTSVVDNGVMFAINGPTGTTADYRLEIQTAANPGASTMSTTTQPWTHGVGLDEATTLTTGVPSASASYYATMVGVVATGEAGGGGTIAIRFKTGGNSATVKTGSWCVYY